MESGDTGTCDIGEGRGECGVQGKRRGSSGARAEIIWFPLEKYPAEDKKHRDIQGSQARPGMPMPGRFMTDLLGVNLRRKSRRKIRGGLRSSWSPEPRFRNQSSRQAEEVSRGHCVSAESSSGICSPSVAKSQLRWLSLYDQGHGHEFVKSLWGLRTGGH